MAVVFLAAAAASAAAAVVVVVAVLVVAPLLDHLPRNDNDDNVVVVQTFHPSSVLVALLDGMVLPPSFLLLPVPHDLLLVVAIGGFVDLALFQSSGLVSSDVDDAQLLLLVHLAAGLLLLLLVMMLVGLEMSSPCREMMFEAYYY